jgi:hypothetical protein
MDHPTTNVREETTDSTYILQEAARAVYERSKKHGQPEDSFRRIAGLWNAYLGFPEDQLLDGEDVVNMMVLMKVARNAEGHYTEDNYADIAGYAENGARLNND